MAAELQADTTAASAALFDRARQLMPGGVNSPVRAFRAVGGAPRFIARGAGARVWDADGHELHRLHRLVGSDDPRARASRRRRGNHAAGSGGHRVRRADRARSARWRNGMTALVPSIEMVRMVNSGTEATMAALRVARGVTGRAGRDQVRGLLSRARRQLPREGGFRSGDVRHARQPRRDRGNGARHRDGALQRSRERACGVRDAHPARIAAVIVEPVVGNMGVVVPRPGFLEGSASSAPRRARC